MINLKEEFDELTKPLIEFIQTHFDPDYDIITINAHDAFINRINDTTIELLNQMGFFATNLNINDKTMKLAKKKE